MTTVEFDERLARLRLSREEAARLLSVAPRTIHSWARTPGDIPGPAEQALRAWLRLDAYGLAWRPDGAPLGEDDPERLRQQIVAHRQHAIELDAILNRVESRGGPATPWKVDLSRRRATLGAITLTFYPLRNGGFSPQSYSRGDIAMDLDRDRPLIEDGYAAIAREIGKAGPHWADDSSR